MSLSLAEQSPHGTCLGVRSAGPGSVAPSPSPLSVSSLGGCAGQALFSGLKIKASWPGPCWQRGGGGGPAPGLKGIWLEKEASPHSTTSVAGSVGGPPKITGASASPAMRGTGGAHLGAFCLGWPLKAAPHSPQKLPATWGPVGDHELPTTLLPPPADVPNNDSYVPTTPAGQAPRPMRKSRLGEV